MEDITSNSMPEPPDTLQLLDKSTFSILKVNTKASGESHPSSCGSHGVANGVGGILA